MSLLEEGKKVKVNDCKVKKWKGTESELNLTTKRRVELNKILFLPHKAKEEKTK